MTDQIRLLLALDGAGAPLVTQCLGAMPGIVMLSRIHPSHVAETNPLEQAYKWFGLVEDADLERLRAQPDWPYHEIMQMIAERAEKKGLTLIIGDRSHEDFVADKPVSEIPGIFLHPTLLESRFTPKSVALVRHPIDHWIHLQNQLGADAPSPEIFMRGCRRFSDCLAGVETLKFEDFLADPASMLKVICDRFDTPYNAGWEAHWRDYKTFVSEPVRDRPEGVAEVTFNDDIMQAFAANDDFAAAAKNFGYAELN